MTRLRWDRPKRPYEPERPHPLQRRADAAESWWRRKWTAPAPRRTASRPKRSAPAPVSASVLRPREEHPALANALTAQVWTDGGCAPNPGPGGWAAIIKSDVGAVELSGAHPFVTNNQMELVGAIRALQALPPSCAVRLYADSKYLVDGMTQWLPGWRRKQFMRGVEPMPNAELWKQLSELVQGRAVRFEWVRGHAGNVNNNRADRLATLARERAAHG